MPHHSLSLSPSLLSSLRLFLSLIDGEGDYSFATSLASKFGSGAAKLGKKAAKSEAGQSATKAAAKGAADAATQDLSDRYLGGKNPYQHYQKQGGKRPPPPASAPAATSKSSSATSKSSSATSKSSSANTRVQRPPPPSSTSHHGNPSHHGDYGGSNKVESHEVPVDQEWSHSHKPSSLSHFVPHINLKSDSKTQSPKSGHPKASHASQGPKGRLAKTPNWDRLLRAKALYNYRAEMQCDLEFRKGQIIQVMTRTGSQFDWWEGKIEDRVGIFPANYVHVLDC